MNNLRIFSRVSKMILSMGLIVATNNAASADVEWTTHHGSLDAHRYAAIDQIDRKTVRNLKVAWIFSLGVPGGLEGTPIVKDGYVYITSGWGDVFKLDLRKNGAQIWHFDAKISRDVGAKTCCGINNRGVAIDENAVYLNTLDGRMIALDILTGDKLWELQLAQVDKGETITNAPLLVDGIAYTGMSGGEYGVRGWIVAVDAKKGIEIWRKYTIPAPGEPGSETWPKDDTWKTGGGPTWITGSYDPKLNSLFWGVGNPGPDWDRDARPGDNLYTNSVLALDSKTGKMKWYFQFTPNDAWDYDGNNESILVDTTIKGQKRNALLHADRNGFFYALDRTNGDFIYATQFVDKMNWTTGIDPVTGKPLNNSAESTPTRENPDVLACPGNMGGKNWAPMSYNPKENVAYIPVIESCGGIFVEPEKYERGELFLGGGLDLTRYRITGSLTAIDVATGQIKWKSPAANPLLGGTLATSGGLVFTGHPDGTLVAYSSDNGSELWNFSLGTGINAPPITYTIDGKQQLAILAGTGGAWPLWFMESTPQLANIRPGSIFVVFEIGK